MCCTSFDGSGAAWLISLFLPLYSSHFFVVPTHTALFAGRQIDLPLLDEQMMTAK